MLETKDPENFELLKKTITRFIGFDCSQYSDNFIKRRIEVRQRANTIDSYLGYISLLKKSLEEREKLDKELSIHVTHFFRDASMWQAFMSDVIPLILSEKSRSSRIRIWCAGCSSGEEPLSIAICFNEKLGRKLKDWNISILGTDIDAETLQKAGKGIYEENQFREMSQEYKARYFDNIGEGLYKAKKEITSLTDYKEADIHKFRMKNSDIIFCRNTVIYFSLPAKSKLYEDFYECLNHNGFLIIGKTEILQGCAREKFQIFDSKERIYVKE